MATTHRLHILNQYFEFRNDNDIDEIINFINSNYQNYPANLIHHGQRLRYNEKFGANSGFQVENNNVLVYFPVPNQQARLIVSRVAEREQNMIDIFNDNQ
jgi:transcriptional regulator of heat shock response